MVLFLFGYKLSLFRKLLWQEAVWIILPILPLCVQTSKQLNSRKGNKNWVSLFYIFTRWQNCLILTLLWNIQLNIVCFLIIKKRYIKKSQIFLFNQWEENHWNSVKWGGGGLVKKAFLCVFCVLQMTSPVPDSKRSIKRILKIRIICIVYEW